MVFDLWKMPLIGSLFKEERDWHWVLALAHEKKIKFPRLSHVSIGQKAPVQETETGGNSQFKHMVEWIYPSDLALAFHESNMKLQVTSLDGSDDHAGDLGRSYS